MSINSCRVSSIKYDNLSPQYLCPIHNGLPALAISLFSNSTHMFVGRRITGTIFRINKDGNFVGIIIPTPTTALPIYRQFLSMNKICIKRDAINI